MRAHPVRPEKRAPRARRLPRARARALGVRDLGVQAGQALLDLAALGVLLAQVCQPPSEVSGTGLQFLQLHALDAQVAADLKDLGGLL